MRQFILLAAAALLLTACGHDENEEAGRYLAAAEKSFSDGNYNDAKLYIDSVRIVYPKAFEARRAGIALMQKVEIAEAERTISYHDSILAVLNKRFEECRRNFQFEKDAQYQDMGAYAAKSQSLENNIGRNYIRGQVDENGKMTLVSNFSDASYIHHRSIRLSAGDSFVETPVSDDFYEFKDLGRCYEKCNFSDGRDGGAAAFIALNRDNDIEVVLNGERNVRMKMKPSDRTAISELYSLSLLLKAIDESESMKSEAQRKIEFVKSNISVTSADCQE